MCCRLTLSASSIHGGKKIGKIFLEFSKKKNYWQRFLVASENLSSLWRKKWSILDANCVSNESLFTYVVAAERINRARELTKKRTYGNFVTIFCFYEAKRHSFYINYIMMFHIKQWFSVSTSTNLILSRTRFVWGI